MKTIKDLKEFIKDLPDNMDVMIEATETDFDYANTSGFEVKEIGYSEEPESKPLSKDTVLIIKELK